MAWSIATAAASSRSAMVVRSHDSVAVTRSGGTSRRRMISWVRLPRVELDAGPPADLVVARATVGCSRVPDVLAGQEAAVGDPGAGFLGDLADQRVDRPLARLDLAAGKVPEAVMFLDEHDLPVGGEAESVGLGDQIFGRPPARGHQRERGGTVDLVDRLGGHERIDRPARTDVRPPVAVVRPHRRAARPAGPAGATRRRPRRRVREARSR